MCITTIHELLQYQNVILIDRRFLPQVCYRFYGGCLYPGSYRSGDLCFLHT